MHIPGHVALALIHHRWLEGESTPLRFKLLASLFPDMVDKTIGYVFHWMPNGRHFAHNVFSLAGVSLLVGVVFGRRVGWAWFGAYLLHLLADMGGRVPWLFPARQYHFEPGRLRFGPVKLAREGVFLGVVLFLCCLPRRKNLL